MVQRPFLIAVLLFFCQYTYSQDQKLQNLLVLPDDTIKVNKLSAFAKALVYQNPRKARELAATALELSKKLHYDEGIASGYSCLGYFDISSGMNRSSIAYFNEAITYYKKVENNIEIAKCLGNLANAYNSLGKNDSGIVYRIASINLLEKQRELPSFPIRGLYLLSMQYHNLAAGYMELFGHSEKALSYYRKAENMARKCNDTAMIIISLNGITEALEKKGQLKEAFVAAEEALRLGKASHNNFLLSEGYHSYSIVLIASNKVDAAIGAARQAIKYAERSGDMNLFIASSITYSAALSKKGDYTRQITLLKKLLEKITAHHYVEYVWKIYNSLAEANYKLGNYKDAYFYLNQRGLYKDSLITIENNKIIADMESRYQAVQKEKELAAKQLQISRKDLQLQKSQQYTVYSMGAGLLILLAAIIFYIDFRNKKKRHQRQLKTIEQEKEIQLLQALMQGEEKERSRIARNLHDGVAGIMSAAKLHLRSLSLQFNDIAMNKEYRQGLVLLDEASSEIRKTSHNLMPELLSKYGLDEALRRYCANISNDQLLIVHYDSWGEIGRYIENFELLVYRIVQELLNNIAKHSKASQAVVQMTDSNNILFISIEDNGIGINDAAMGEGMGLHTIKERVESMNGTVKFDSRGGYGLNAYLEFDTTFKNKKNYSDRLVSTSSNKIKPDYNKIL